jgi:hypothetical protein
MSIAREQEAKLWELRAATSLARLWGEQRRRAEARELLAPVYGWFTALRGGPFAAYPRQEMVVAEGVGYSGGPAAGDASSHCRGCPAPGRGSAPDVGRR